MSSGVRGDHGPRGVGAAAGPLIGGLITSAISWRAAFVFQALVIGVIVLLSRRIRDPLPADPGREFDTGGAVVSAVGLVLIVAGILAADDNVWLMLALLALGVLVLLWFFRGVRAKEERDATVDSTSTVIWTTTSAWSWVTSWTRSESGVVVVTTADSWLETSSHRMRERRRPR
ncbi:hypothetical protein [Georgenia sp. SUBG003]|uniref:hypothetical protein n=1 Tax=Georgenia sp. SUBG003 TaxID=1497974 RepID=UPI003AB70C72